MDEEAEPECGPQIRAIDLLFSLFPPYHHAFRGPQARLSPLLPLSGSRPPRVTEGQPLDLHHPPSICTVTFASRVLQSTVSPSRAESIIPFLPLLQSLADPVRHP